MERGIEAIEVIKDKYKEEFTPYSQDGISQLDNLKKVFEKYRLRMYLKESGGVLDEESLDKARQELQKKQSELNELYKTVDLKSLQAHNRMSDKELEWYNWARKNRTGTFTELDFLEGMKNKYSSIVSEKEFKEIISNCLNDDVSSLHIDCHTHSYSSDGSCPALLLPGDAKYNGIMILALTDHDNIDGLEELIDGNFIINANLRIIPGIEFNTTDDDGKPKHIVGYFPGSLPKVILESEVGKRCQEINIAREKRMHKIIEKFNIFFEEYKIPNFSRSVLFREDHNPILNLDISDIYSKVYIASQIADRLAWDLVELQNNKFPEREYNYKKYVLVGESIFKALKNEAEKRAKSKNISLVEYLKSYPELTELTHNFEFDPSKKYNWRDIIRKNLIEVDKILDIPLPCHVPTRGEFGKGCSTEEAIRLIKQNRGYAFLAHPDESFANFDEFAQEALRYKKIGLDGIEAHSSKNKKENVPRYVSFARSNGFYVSAGSDFHGTKSGKEGSIQLGQLVSN